MIKLRQRFRNGLLSMAATILMIVGSCAAIYACESGCPPNSTAGKLTCYLTGFTCTPNCSSCTCTYGNCTVLTLAEVETGNY